MALAVSVSANAFVGLLPARATAKITCASLPISELMSSSLMLMETAAAGRSVGAISADEIKRTLATEVTTFKSVDVDYNKYCKKKDPNTVYQGALLNAWSVYLLHWKGLDNSGVEIEQAVQLLSKCSALYFGDHNGASCSQWEKRFIQLQDQWNELP
jgi:hypothetical protein